MITHALLAPASTPVAHGMQPFRLRFRRPALVTPAQLR
jgi:hypothetical protein